MRKDSSFHDHIIHDVLKGIRGISSRAMFGGWGIYQDELIFAIIADGELYFKVDDGNRADFEKADSHPFVYGEGKHKPTTMSYWLVPEEVMEDKEELHEWVENSVRASKRSKKRK